MSHTLMHPETDDAVRFTLRFFHPEQLPAFARNCFTAADLTAVSARFAGTDEATVRRTQHELAQQAKAAGEGLLARPGITDAVMRLPFNVGDTVVALGDSITDDSLSWARQLEHLLQIARPELAVTVVNAGITATTTTDAIARIDQVVAARPDWVIQMLGTNDVRIHGSGSAFAAPMLTPTETERNMRVLGRLIEEGTGARLVRMTPPPVIELDSQQWESFRAEGISWSTSDVDALIDAIHRLDPDAVDIGAPFRNSDERLLLPDGVHPTVAGQQAILRQLVIALARMT